MGILSWDKPQKIMSIDGWKSNQADSAPPGTYISNMSDEDILKWKAKFVGHKAGHPQVEIRHGNTVIIVNVTGWYKYKHYDTRAVKCGWNETKPVPMAGVHIATAGPLIMNWETLEEFNRAIIEAKRFLEEYENNEHN